MPNEAPRPIPLQQALAASGGRLNDRPQSNDADPFSSGQRAYDASPKPAGFGER